MSLQVEKLEKNMAKLTVEVPAEEFEASIKKAYNKNKNKFNIPGFRKGKAPQNMIEKMYGAGVFYEDAADEAINNSCGQAMRESELDIVSRPEVNVEQIEKGKPFIYTALVAVRPEVTLGEYKGVEVEKVDDTVTEADMTMELRRVQEQNARMLTVEDRPIAEGDEVTLDFDGYVDGKPFEGGKAEGYKLVIGSHAFIDTFEEQLVGKNIGDECEVKVTFPEQYHAEELAGKPAVFKVKIHEVRLKELPELDDEFASEISEFETLDEYKKDLEKKVAERKQQNAASANEDRVVAKVVENASMEIPDPMITAQVDSMIQDTARRMESQNIPFDMYLKYIGMDMEKLREQMRPQAIKQIETRLVLDEIVKQENIKVPEETFDKAIAELAANYKMEAEQVKQILRDQDKKQIEADLAVQEAVDFLVAEAKLV